MDKAQELKIFAELQKGSEDAFTEVYEAHRDKFINFARKYELPQDEIIDVYQDAYIVFHENVLNGKLKVLSSTIGTYLFGIGKYMILEKLRKLKKTVPSEQVLSVVKDDLDWVDKQELIDEPLTREQQLLQKFFSTLGEQCQKLLTLFYYRGFTIEEIMKSEGYNSLNVVKSQKSRCLKTLKERIKKST